MQPLQLWKTNPTNHHKTHNLYIKYSNEGRFQHFRAFFFAIYTNIEFSCYLCQYVTCSTFLVIAHNHVFYLTPYKLQGRIFNLIQRFQFLGNNNNWYVNLSMIPKNKNILFINWFSNWNKLVPVIIKLVIEFILVTISIIYIINLY